MNEQKEKKLDELISRTIGSGEPKFDSEKWKQKYPDEFQMLLSRTRGGTGRQANVWRLILSSRITKLAAAAVIIVAVGITIAVLSSSQSTVDRQQVVQRIEEPAGRSDEHFVPGAVVDVTTTSAKLEAEQKQVEQMFAAGDVDGLVAMLSDGEFGTKVAAANYLAQIGDLNSVPVLEQLDSEYGSDEPAFANAIAAIEDRAESVATEGTEDTSAIDAEGMVLVQSSGTAEQTGDELLQLVPGASLFCVRVNNLDSAFGTMDQFLAGASPVPAGTTMVARMQLAGVLGDPALNNVNTIGNFAIFGLSLPGESESESMENLFVGCLVPVTDYAKFVSDNTNCDEPDANGVSIIKCGGTVNPDKKMLVTQVANYALVSSSNAYDKLVSAAKSISAGNTGLGSILDANDVKAATKEPLWAYVNIQRASKVFGPVLTAKLQEMKKQIEKINASKKGGPPPAAMNMYFGMLDILMKEVNSVSISIKPQEHVCNLKMNAVAVPETYMARMFTANESSKTENNLLGYLQDGAIFNLGVKMNTPFWEEFSLSNFDLILFLDEGDVSDGTVEKVEKLVADMIASAGGPGVISGSFDEKSVPPFAYRHVVAVKDAERWNKANEGIMEIWNTSGFAETYRKLGMETNYEITHGTDTYRDVSIDGAKFSMKSTDANSDYGKMIDQIYGGGIDYRWAIVDGFQVMAFGSDCNSAIYDLIDQVKAGGPEQMATEMQAALAVLTEAERSEFVGTFNYIRMFKMVAAMTPEDTNGFMAPPRGLPQIDIPTKSNIAFAGKVGNSKMTVEVALPKEHMLEFKAALEAMHQAMAEARKAAKQAAASGAEEPNSPERVDELSDSNDEPLTDPCSLEPVLEVNE